MAPDEKEKASVRAERLLIEGMLGGTYPPGSDLPGERDLCKQLGVARPALREALQRLSRDGWLSIQHGKPTRVNHILRDGNLNVLIDLLAADITLMPDFIPNLLEIWSLLAPAYTRSAIEHDAQAVCRQIEGYRGLAGRSRPTVRAQWRLHRRLIELSGNPVFGLILNSFFDFYRRLAVHYYASPDMRAEARAFWERMLEAAASGDAETASAAMWDYMLLIRTRWPQMDVSAWLKDDSDIRWDEEEASEEEMPAE